MASISNVKLPNSVTYTVRSNSNLYGTCAVGASTQTKSVSVTNGSFTLEDGARVIVNFTNDNSADNPKLQVNGTTATFIFYNGSQITTDDKKLLIKGVCEFVYHDAHWNLVIDSIDYDVVQQASISGSIAMYDFWFGTQAQYDAITTKDPNTFYFINE